MIYVAILLGLFATCLMLGLGMAAKRGDEKLEAYHRARWEAEHGDD